MNFFKEKCPHCKEILQLKNNPDSKSIIIKECPAGHYQKEFHPALETYIESHKVS
ncbi:hypothetical protein [Mesobacillus subterraneus]|uniref:hypothetical protein n=1 Tax=Mesobacillus subterraneus TaxID=285983 RepID=UPI001475B798|nr:hypothetical protein [Mesobacillus subterraneus]